MTAIAADRRRRGAHPRATGQPVARHAGQRPPPAQRGGRPGPARLPGLRRPVRRPDLELRRPTRSLLGDEDGVKRLTPPCIHLLGCPPDQPQHIFGVDANARDEFSRVIHGARVSLRIGFVTVGFAIVIGTPDRPDRRLRGGWLDTILMRGHGRLLVFPALLLAIAIVDRPRREPRSTPSSRSASWPSRSTPGSCARPSCRSGRTTS